MADYIRKDSVVILLKNLIKAEKNVYEKMCAEASTHTYLDKSALIYLEQILEHVESQKVLHLGIEEYGYEPQKGFRKGSIPPPPPKSTGTKKPSNA